MDKIQIFDVAPAIPEKLAFLETLANNLWWSWNHDAIELFRRIDREHWKQADRNPVVFLQRIPQKHLSELIADESFMAHLERVRTAFEKSVLNPRDKLPFAYQENEVIAYFSAEFGVHESVPLFAGGLGVLAGDHLKAASNMGLPLVAVGLLYRHGYFRQHLNNDGWQQESYPPNEIHNLPVSQARDADGNDLIISVPVPDGELRALVWKVQIGRIPLYLLDADMPENSDELREVTAQLYGGGEQTRLLQEFLLGIGGMRALSAMNIHPTVCHMNEGHSAFISLERIHRLMTLHELDLDTALAVVRRTNVFTTHTPVAAGHDEFRIDMVHPYLEPLQEKLGVEADKILEWGRLFGDHSKAPFSMTVLALHMAQDCNGVSELHGQVARRMWRPMWPGKPEHEIPISHITNGVHTPSWISGEHALLFDRYLGPNWHLQPCSTDMAERIDRIPDDELWRAHQLCRTRLIRECRSRYVQQLTERNARQSEIEQARSILDPNALTIGFARRFAAYKRATLIFSDPERIEAMLSSSEQPIQLILAGKAHPADDEGKELIRRIVRFMQREGVNHRVLFIEDYNIDIARFLLQGVDVWLNTPRRPQEASGTSGMKAAVNGALNVSILDGWWCEGYDKSRGWRIGNGEEYEDTGFQDEIESKALYMLLEEQVIPLFYNRSQEQIPVEWVAMMKESIKMSFSMFSSHRMVREYETRYYSQAIERYRELRADHWTVARNLAKHLQRLRTHWQSIRINTPVPEMPDGRLRVGDSFHVSAVVSLGALHPNEVLVECYYGELHSAASMSNAQRQQMTPGEVLENGEQRYECTIRCQQTGRFGLTARVMAQGDTWTRNQPGLITWAPGHP